MTDHKELIERLREYGDDPQDVSHGEIAEWMHKSADALEAAQEQVVEVKPLQDTIASLLHRLDVALAPEDGGISMHARGQTPDWFVEAAYQAAYGRPSSGPLNTRSASEVYAEATAAAKAQVSGILNYVEQHDRPDWANLGTWAHAIETAGMRVRDEITPQSARDWLAQHDREIERNVRTGCIAECQHLAAALEEKGDREGMRVAERCGEAIRAGGEQ